MLYGGKLEEGTDWEGKGMDAGDGHVKGQSSDLKLMAGKLLAPLRDLSLLVHLCPVVFVLWTVL